MHERVEYNVGEKIGECFFISYAPNNKHHCRMVNVKCKCGKEFTSNLSSIKSGHTKSCGCGQVESAKKQAIEYDKGQKIGALTFLNRAGMDGDSSLGNFLCACGKEFIIRIQNAKSGRTKSCGCMTKKLASDIRTIHKLPVKIIKDGLTRYKLIPSFSKEKWASFWRKVKLTANPFVCWDWTGTGERYGSFTIGEGIYKSNRIAFFLHNGIDPKELSVLHKCDNPKCCNPNHLYIGTHSDNMQDMVRKGRFKSRWETKSKQK